MMFVCNDPVLLNFREDVAESEECSETFGKREKDAGRRRCGDRNTGEFREKLSGIEGEDDIIQCIKVIKK